MVSPRAFLMWGTALIAVFLLLPQGIPRDVVYLVLGLSAVTAIVVGIRRFRPESATAWWFFALGQLSWVTGDTIYSYYEDVLQVSPFPSPADAGYLLAYPLLFTGLVLLIRRAEGGVDPRRLIDSVIVLVALGLLSWAWIAQPMIDVDVPGFERAISVASPAGDILLLAGLVGLVSAGQRSTLPLRLMAGAITLQVVADTALAAGIASDGYAPWLDVLWLGQFVLWGACALHPQMSQVAAPTNGRVDHFTMRRVVVLGGAALLPSVTTAVTLAAGHPAEPWVLTVGSIVLILLVVARMALGIVEIRFTALHRDELEELLFHRAAHDSLTGTYNRAAMLSAVDEAASRTRANGTETGLLVIELDDFKRVDADLGPVAADELLVSTAQRITETVGDHAVGRLGGAQFGVLVEHPEARQEATRLAELLAGALTPPHAVASRPVQVRARVGVTLSADGHVRAADLVDQASRASHETLRSVESFGVFDEELRRELTEQARIESGLRQAIADDELVLHYQPVVEAGSLEVTGYEALIRWDRGGDELTMPDSFIPVAETSDIISDVGRWALREATRQFASWRARDPETFATRTVAVNISGRHLADRAVVDDVTAALDQAGLPARHLVIELTETVLVGEDVVEQLEALRALGVTISLDDFGTGYTSIRQLRRLPVDILKIDRSLVAGVEPGSTELIALTTAAAHACGLRVVAEGVERDAQLAMLRRLNCDAVQGFLFARPLTREAVLAAG